MAYVQQKFQFQFLNFDNGLKYLGFHLKPNNYKKIDWIWLLEKIKKRLKVWRRRWLPRVGRLVLIKSILEAIPVLWMSLSWIPKGILNFIQKCCCGFLWRGNIAGKTFSWV